MPVQIQLRHDTAANWTSANPTLALGEAGYETDTGKIKIGDGSTAWSSLAYRFTGFVNPMTTQDDIIVGGASGAPARLAKGTDGQVLTVDPTTHHLVWATPAAASGDVATDLIWDAKGDLAVGTGSNTAARLAVGSNGQVLTADSTQTTGVKWAAASGSGFTHAYAGYNTVGGSSEASVANRQYMKSFTLAAAGVITSLGVYIKTNTDGASGMVGLILADSGGAPADILAITGSQTQNFMVQESSSAHTGPAQWVHLPVGLYVPSGTYWMGWMTMNTQIDFYYDGSGSDQYGTSTTTFVFDGRRYTLTNSTKKYSARVSVIS